MDRLIVLSPNFPDVCKELTSLSSKIVQSLILMGNQWPSSLRDVLATLTTLLLTYPGSCGNTSNQVTEDHV